MDITVEIPKVENICENIDDLLHDVSTLDKCESTNQTKLKLKEAYMWLKLYLVNIKIEGYERFREKND